MSKESDFQEILENGINFGRGGGPRKEEDKVKTKAKKRSTSLVLTVVALPSRRPNAVSNGPTGISDGRGKR
jgi:hypothetical protein